MSDVIKQELDALRREHGGWCWARAKPGAYSLGQHFVAMVRDETYETWDSQTDRTIWLRLVCKTGVEAAQLARAIEEGNVEFRGLALRCEHPSQESLQIGIQVEVRGLCVWGPAYDGYQGIEGHRVT